MTYEELKNSNAYYHHHSAYHRGYVSRRSDGIVTEYNGRFGKGYIVDCPNWKSTQYCIREYWIEREV